MSFELTIQNYENEADSTVIQNPTTQDIEKAIYILKENSENFIILASDIPIDTFKFIQAAFYKDGTFYTEVQYTENSALYMYCNRLTEKELLNILLDYLSNKGPNIAEWEYLFDFTDYKFYKEYELRKLLQSKGFNVLKCKEVPPNSIRLDTTDLQVLLKYLNDHDISDIFYCYSCVNKEPFEISGSERDSDLFNIANKEIVEYLNNIESINFKQSAILELFCLHNGTAITLRIIAPWLRELTPANKYLETLKKKYENDLNNIKLQRDQLRDSVLEELRTILLVDNDFSLCTNQNLRRDFMRKFLAKKENEKYKQAFLSSNGYLNTYDMCNFADMIYAVYKQSKKR